MIPFSPTEDQKMMQDAVAQLARTVLRPRIREIEAGRAVPEDIRKTAHEMGLGLAALPASIGGRRSRAHDRRSSRRGSGVGRSRRGIRVRRARRLRSCALRARNRRAGDKTPRAVRGSRRAHSRFGAVAWGEPKARPDRAGSRDDGQGRRTGLRLVGEKAYVVNADRADAFVVFATGRVEGRGRRAIGAFVVEKGNPGLAVSDRARRRSASTRRASAGSTLTTWRSP